MDQNQVASSLLIVEPLCQNDVTWKGVCDTHCSVRVLKEKNSRYDQAWTSAISHDCGRNLQWCRGCLSWCDFSIYRVIGVVKDAVFYMSIGSVVNVCSAIISWEASENGCSNWCELQDKWEREKVNSSNHPCKYNIYLEQKKPMHITILLSPLHPISIKTKNQKGKML